MPFDYRQTTVVVGERGRGWGGGGGVGECKIWACNAVLGGKKGKEKGGRGGKGEEAKAGQSKHKQTYNEAVTKGTHTLGLVLYRSLLERETTPPPIRWSMTNNHSHPFFLFFFFPWHIEASSTWHLFLQFLLCSLSHCPISPAQWDLSFTQRWKNKNAPHGVIAKPELTFFPFFAPSSFSLCFLSLSTRQPTLNKQAKHAKMNRKGAGWKRKLTQWPVDESVGR